MVAHAGNPITWEVNAEGFSLVHSEFQTSLGYSVRLFQTQHNTTVVYTESHFCQSQLYIYRLFFMEILNIVTRSFLI